MQCVPNINYSWTYPIWKKEMQQHKRKARQINKVRRMDIRVLDDQQTYTRMVEEMAIRGIAVLYERACLLGGRTHTVI